MKLVIIFAVLLLLTCVSCAQEAKGLAAKGPIQLAWHGKMKDHEMMTSYALTLISLYGLKDVRPADAKEFCPKFDKLSESEREEFFAFLISKMVERESNFNSSMKYQENFKDQQGKYIISRGLLQISIESATSYGCDLPHRSQSLHDPKKNIACGVKILSKWVKQDGRIAGKLGDKWRGGARYWSVLRSVSGSYPKIKAYTRGLALCRA